MFQKEGPERSLLEGKDLEHCVLTPTQPDIFCSEAAANWFPRSMMALASHNPTASSQTFPQLFQTWLFYLVQREKLGEVWEWERRWPCSLQSVALVQFIRSFQELNDEPPLHCFFTSSHLGHISWSCTSFCICFGFRELSWRAGGLQKSLRTSVKQAPWSIVHVLCLRLHLLWVAEGLYHLREEAGFLGSVSLLL